MPLFEAILADPDASHADRLRADERLSDLEREEHRAVAAQVAQLAPEDVEAELRRLAHACEGGLVLMRGPVAVELPVEEVELRRTLELALTVNDKLERPLAKREQALQAADMRAAVRSRAGVGMNPAARE